jgi:hypothetical protein
MKNIDEFKSFVRSKPLLVKYVNSGEMTWQKFYDMWYLYGADNNDVWNKYSTKAVEETKEAKGASTFASILGMLKGLDLESVRSGIEGVQKAIGIVQDINKNNSNSNSNNNTNTNNQNFMGNMMPYNRDNTRAMFRRFED